MVVSQDISDNEDTNEDGDGIINNKPVASQAVIAMVAEHDCFFFNFGVFVEISNCPEMGKLRQNFRQPDRQKYSGYLDIYDSIKSLCLF